MHMSNEHHHHDEANTYYLDQLCSVGITGAIGVIMVLLYQYGALSSILHPKFHLPVLAGGIALIAVVAVRGVFLWRESGKAAAHAHGHSHAHDHGHDHSHGHGHAHDHDHSHGHDHAHGHDQSHDYGECDHDHDHSHQGHDHAHAHDHSHSHGHDHGHDHGFAPWRYAVLLLPVVLFFLNMPPVPVQAADTEPVEEGVYNIGFKEAEESSRSPLSREQWEGKLVRVKGQYAPGPDDRRFRLYRLKMTCCAADAYPLNLEIESPVGLDVKTLSRRWVRVIGEVHFQKLPGREEYVTTLKVRKLEDGKPDILTIEPDPTPFLY